MPEEAALTLAFVMGVGVGGLGSYLLLVFLAASKVQRDDYETPDSACTDCSRAGYSCPVYPQTSSHCVERRK